MTIIDMDKMGEALNTKADIDLNNTGVFSTSEGGVVNLTSSTPADASGKEVTSADFFQSNLLNYTTNRILEIPQDIKLELNNGTLTLKAGSKVYVPNGFEADGTTPKFDVVTIENDIVSKKFSSSGTNFIRYENGFLFCDWHVSDFSSSSNTSSVTGWYYDTSKNEIKYYKSGVAKNHTVGFPFGVVTVSNGIVASIDQIFNGFGYIGSTVFVLPGVKVQIPNGRNADGTCKSLITNITSVKTLTVNASWGTYDIFITRNGGIGRWPDIVSGSAGTRYNAATNYYEVIGEGKWNPQLDCVFVKIKTDTTSPYKITSFEPFTVDSVVNSNEFYQLKDKAVTTDTTQTISGSKRFTPPPEGMSIELTADTNQQTVPAADTVRQIGLYRNATYSKGDGFTSWIHAARGSDGWSGTEIYTRRFLESDSQEILNYVKIDITSDGIPVSYTKTPPVGVTGEEIVTAGWVNSKIQLVNELPTNPVAGVLYCIPEK